MANLKSMAFSEVTEGCNIEKFELSGANVHKLVKAFVDMLGKASRHGDFTSVLSP